MPANGCNSFKRNAVTVMRGTVYQLARNTQSEEQERISSILGADLGFFCFTLCEELLGINYKWGVYRTLFANSPERINTLNKACSSLFAVMQEALYDEVIMSVVRLSDPERTAGNTNFSICQLPSLLKECEVSVDNEKADALVEKTKEKAERLRRSRNKTLAHLDFSYVKEDDKSSFGISRAEIEDALKALVDVLNILYPVVNEGNIVSFDLIRQSRDIDAFVAFLEKTTMAFPGIL